MAKDYICKHCPYNNNGWCNIKKIQGLKNVLKCSDYDNFVYKNLIIEDAIPEASKAKFLIPEVEENNTKENDIEEKIDVQAHKIFGKIEMYFNLQMQIRAMPKENISEDLKEFIQVFNNIGKMLLVESEIHNVENSLTSMIEQDIFNGFNMLLNESLKKYGEYKRSK